jgi:hypothetical protein
MGATASGELLADAADASATMLGSPTNVLNSRKLIAFIEDVAASAG